MTTFLCTQGGRCGEVQLYEVQITNVVSMALPNKCLYKLLSSYSILTVPQHKDEVLHVGSTSVGRALARVAGAI